MNKLNLLLFFLIRVFVLSCNRDELSNLNELDNQHTSLDNYMEDVVRSIDIDSKLLYTKNYIVSPSNELNDFNKNNNVLSEM